MKKTKKPVKILNRKAKNVLMLLFSSTGNGNQVDPGYDLAFMSSCDHIILSYGTFGMMAAWFNGHGN